MKKQNGFTLLETIVTVILVGVLAVVAVPLYTSYINNAKVDKAQSSCELVATAIANQHVQGLDLAANNWTSLGITNPADNDWTYTFPAINAVTIMDSLYFISATNAKLGTKKLYPKRSGTSRWQ